MTLKEFTAFCSPSNGQEAGRCKKYFAAIGWREGYNYCCNNPDYIRLTAYQPLKRDKLLPGMGNLTREGKWKGTL